MEAQLDGPHTGKVARIGPERRFGYVTDATGTQHFIFVVGTAISNREAAKLRVGAAVRFEVVGQGRVERLVVI